jgi:outer membrane protein assembly factor BamB
VADQQYEGALNLAPGAQVTLKATVGGSTYSASSAQFSAYPAITSPPAGTTWSLLNDNLVAWSEATPSASALFALAVLDTNGQLVWPASGGFQIVQPPASSYTIGHSSLTAGSRYVLVGVATVSKIPSADSSSGLVIGGFNYVPVSVSSNQVASLVSIVVTPVNATLGPGKSVQLTAIGTYSDSTTQDLTAQVTWSSSSTAEATVSGSGAVTGVSGGTPTITATLSGVSGSTTVTVFQPTPSPAPPLSQAVAYQIDYAHSGFVTFGAPITFPSAPAWSVTLSGNVSYPLIAGGKVFVTARISNDTFDTNLYALDKATGAIVWGPVKIAGTNLALPWSGHAYDQGKLFVLNNNGLLQSFDATTGQPGWSVTLGTLGYNFYAPPTAVNGIVYVSGNFNLYAVDESNGNILWDGGVADGDASSPAVSADGVFVSYPCNRFKFDPITGASLWHVAQGCSGGGGNTPVYSNGRLYVRDWTTSPTSQILDASNGTVVGSFMATPPPALTAQTGYFLSTGVLSAVDLATQSARWTFTGDGMLVSAPIVIDQVVIVTSASGNVYALDATTGTQLWTAAAGAAITTPNELYPGWPLPGTGAGEGYLVVPAGSVLTAWHLAGP